MPAAFEPAIYSAGSRRTSSRPTARLERGREQPPFMIIEPPPNITGALHLGHAQRTAVEDLMIRRARMQGKPTLWLPGVDHASIAAQLVLDKIIAAEGESRESLGRERYLERMWRVHGRDARRRCRPAASPRRLASTGPRSASRWTRAARRPCASPSSGSTTTGWRIAARSSSTGARVAARACRDLEVIATPENGQALVPALPPAATSDGTPDPERDDHGGDDASRDDPRRHRRGRASRRRPLRARSSGGACASRSSSGTCRSSPTRWSTASSARAR